MSNSEINDWLGPGEHRISFRFDGVESNALIVDVLPDNKVRLESYEEKAPAAIACATDMRHARNIQDETDAVGAVFTRIFHQDGKALEWTDGLETNRFTVVFIANGISGWDGNIAPMPNNFDPPPGEWLQKLSVPGLEVTSVTNMTWTEKAQRLKDKNTGKPGLIFAVDAIEWISANEIRMKAQTYYGFMNASGASYVLRSEQGTWHVVTEKNHWVQ